eukprot:7584917-Prorocentrum_lima.AAC.1
MGRLSHSSKNGVNLNKISCSKYYIKHPCRCWKTRLHQLTKYWCLKWKSLSENGHVPKRRDCSICQQAQGPVVRHHQHPPKVRNIWNLACGFDGTSGHRVIFFSRTSIHSDHGTPIEAT